jgi:flagellar hook-associated protein 3 FlgL
MRVPTLHTSRQQLDIISTRQAEQVRLQQQIASGVRVRGPGDDPAAAAQAELARSSLARLAQDQRATQLATSVLSTADGAIARGVDLLQSARDGLVAAGNPAYSATDRQALAMQLRSAREQLLQVANATDGAGGYVFGGQGTATQPVGGSQNPAFLAPAGEQRIGDGGAYDATVDGRAVFIAVPEGNGVFSTASAAGNTGGGWIGAGSVYDANLLTGRSYEITIGGTAAAPTYAVTDTSTTPATPVSSGPFTSGADIDIAGQRVRISGTPATGDRFELAPAGQRSVFATLDDAIAMLESTTLSKPAYNERLEQALTGVDRALDGFNLARARVGESLKGVDAATSQNELSSIAQTARKSGLVDTDIPQAIADLQASQASTEAALKVYASSGRKSLFDLLG